MPENSEPDSSTGGPAVTSPVPPPSNPRTTAPPATTPPSVAARRASRVPWWTWRESAVILPRTTLLAVAAMAVVGALCWRIDEAGVGVTLTGIAILTTVIVTAPADYRARMSPYWYVIAVGIVGLVSVPMFRAAGWVNAFCIIAAIVAGAALFVEANGLRGLWLAALSPAFAPFQGLTAAFRQPPKPPRTTPRPRLGMIAIVAGTTIVLLIVFGALFASADATFGSLFSFELSNPIAPNVMPALIAGGVIGGFTLGGVTLVAQGTRYPVREVTNRPPTWAWAVPVGGVLAMFVLFLGVQATALFGGDDFVQRTADLTYSEYARQGFWQLLVVGILVIGVAVTAWHFVDADDPTSRRTARILLGSLCVATLAVGASAIHRMTRYINAYGMTEDRVFGVFVELLVAMVMVGFLVVGVRMTAAGLTRTLVALGLFATLGFAAFNPDRYIADYNIDRYEATGKIDAYFLGGLSADAASEFHRLPKPLRDCANWRFAERQRPASWREFSFSRYDAGPSPIPRTAYFTSKCEVESYQMTSPR